MQTHWVLGALLLVVGAFVACFLVIARGYGLERMQSHQRVHVLFHESRDEVSRMLKGDASNDRRHYLDEFHLQTVGRIANSCRQIKRDRHVDCAIRLAQAGDGQEMYVTRRPGRCR